MTDKTPVFPGKPAQTGAQPKPAWADAICPFLTAGEIARQGPPSSLVQLGPEKKAQIGAQACMGPRCMLFVSIGTPDGKTLSGCAPVHAFQAQIGLNQMVARFIAAAEAGAAAEAARAATGAVDAAAAAIKSEPAPPIPLVHDETNS